MSLENSCDCEGANHVRAFSAKRFQLVPPGPMAQAVTFRAFGAETGVSTQSLPATS
jgi:hypothetical protein